MKGMPFSADSVRAIMEDRKTQTRRLIKPQPAEKPLVDGFEYWHWIDTKGIGHDKKPRYQVGEVVYVREAWRPYGEKEVRIEYKSDGAIIEYPGKPVFFFYGCGSSWRSLLPAWAARLFVQITAVRPERLQEITYSDVAREGFEIETGCNPIAVWSHAWSSLNPKHPWADNDWVWVYTFLKVEKP